MTTSGTKIYKTTTWSPGPGCHGGCGVLAHVKDGKLIKYGPLDELAEEMSKKQRQVLWTPK